MNVISFIVNSIIFPKLKGILIKKKKKKDFNQNSLKKVFFDKTFPVTFDKNEFYKI